MDATRAHRAPQPLPQQPAPALGGPGLLVWFGRVALCVAACTVVFGALAVAGGSLYTLSHRGEILSGVRVGGVDLSGMTPEEATRLLVTQTNPAGPGDIVLVDGQTRNTLSPADLGLSFDLASTISDAYDIGRSGNALADVWQQYAAWHDGVDVAPVWRFDESKAFSRINDLAAASFVPVREASLTATGSEVTVQPGQIGRQLDAERALNDVKTALLALKPAEITLAYRETAPRILDATVQADAARQILSQPLTLTIASPLEGDPADPVIVSPEQLATMLRINRIEDGNSARFEVGLDPEALRQLLTPMVEPLARQGQNARFVFNDDTRQLDPIAPSQDARALDVDATIEAINQSLVKGTHNVPLAFVVTPPQVPDTAKGTDLGITELVSDQYTSFKGSTAERMQNIKAAAARFHGLLVAPGATFSFSDNIGDISLDSGFAEALIIYGGRTIRGIGGGVCQVSTTLFRAVYFGGFPLVERNAHAYRVGYYEQTTNTWSGPGLDAAVYTPLVDFKFVNDTPYWLLMETYFYPSAQRLEWKFYSTSDGRTTTVNAATVSNIVAAPEPSYEENPELAAGEVKQVDYQADGADVMVTRTVMRDGAQLYADESPIVTHYQPWRAIYQYGPGTPNMPPPPPTGATP